MRGLAVTVLALGGCTEPTQLVVVVRSDLAIDGEIDAFRVVVEPEDDRGVRVEGPGKDQYDRPVPLDDQFDLPATFGVAPRGRDDRSVTVRARAMLDGLELFETR